MSHTWQRAAQGRWPRGSGDWSSQVENPHRRGANPVQITQLQEDTREHFMPPFALHTQKRPPVGLLGHQAPRPPPCLPAWHPQAPQPAGLFFLLFPRAVVRNGHQSQPETTRENLHDSGDQGGEIKVSAGPHTVYKNLGKVPFWVTGTPRIHPETKQSRDNPRLPLRRH